MGGDRWVVLLSRVVEVNEYRQVQLTKKIEKREEHAERQNEKNGQKMHNGWCTTCATENCMHVPMSRSPCEL